MEEQRNQEQQTTFEEEKQSAFIKCEGCGSNMTFDPLSQKLKCDYCGREEDFAKDSSVKELEIEQAFAQEANWDEAVTYNCENCGAKFLMQAAEVAVTCPYCGTSHIVKTENLTGIKPSAVYPFLLDKFGAVEHSKKWAKKRIFAPSAFKKNLIEENVRGVYYPCFTFDSDTKSVYEGRLGERRTRTVRRNGKTHTETYIHWHYVKGRFNKFFDDVTITAGDMSQQHLDKISPFKRETLCVYEKKFLSGYMASHYSRDIKTCWSDAKKVIDARLQQDILHSYGYDVIDYLNVSTTHNDVTYKYVLLPTYHLHYRYNKKDYPVIINGNSGKVTGKAPVSPLRVIIAVILGLALLCGIGYAYLVSEEMANAHDIFNEICLNCKNLITK